jgi:phosphate transport system substrate-binding protein
MKRLIAFTTLASTLVACGGSNSVRLTGSGATFPATFYQRAFNDYTNKTEGVFVNYQATGSGAGVRQYNGGTIDFGASDKVISDSKIKEPVVQIPMTGGAIVPTYNKPGCDLKLTQVQLVRVFNGSISDWKDLGCEEGKITVVYRSDGSGTTAGFTSSLKSFSPEWTIGSGKSVAWPTGVGSKGNAGVSATIKNTPGSIGYLNYSFIKQNNFQQPLLENKEGNYVKASAETSAEGLSKIILDDKLRGSNPNPVGANSYPIVSLTWILARPEHPKNDVMKDLFRYMLSDEAQDKADSLGYVPLPSELRQISLDIIETLK